MDQLGYNSITWRRKTSNLRSKKTNKTVKYPPKLMVWGWFDYYGTGHLVWIQDNMKAVDYIKVLREHLPLNEDFIFLQDGASVHTADISHNFLHENHIRVIEDFPPQSPDLNPAEHIWASMKKELKGRSAKDLEELWRIIKEIWENISIEYLHRLIDSMPARLQAVKKARGGNTKY